MYIYIHITVCIYIYSNITHNCDSLIQGLPHHGNHFRKAAQALGAPARAASADRRYEVRSAG